MSKVPWKPAAIGSGVAAAAGCVALSVLVSKVDDSGVGDFYFFNVPFYVGSWFIGTLALWLGAWAAVSVVRCLIT